MKPCNSLDEMLAKDPNNTFYLYVKGYLYHNMKDYDKAIEYYKKTIEVDPTCAEAYSNLGLIYCCKLKTSQKKLLLTLMILNIKKIRLL